MAAALRGKGTSLRTRQNLSRNPWLQSTEEAQRRQRLTQVDRPRAIQAELQYQKLITDQRQREVDKLRQEWAEYERKQEEQRKRDEQVMFGPYTEALPKALEVAADLGKKLLFFL
jgi:hypothetical protein